MSKRKSLANLKVGCRVEYTVLLNNSKKRVLGLLAYGPGSFHLKPNENDWCGVVLDEPHGKNNGSVQGKQYFDCADNHGVMVRASSLRPLPEGSRIPPPRSGSTTPSSTPSMTPSSSIASFTGMFDSGQAGKDKAMSESVNIPSTPVTATNVSRLKPPTKIMSLSSQDVSNNTQIPKPSSIPAPKDNIRQMVEKIETKRDEKIREESATQHISHKVPSSGSFDSSSKEFELNETIKDLDSKLNTLMAVRAQDKQKFKDLERLKIQNEQLLENKRQMAEKVAELSKQKATAEKAAQDAKEEQQRQSEEIKDLIDNAEMAVIDKEMAENKAEQLQIELEQTKEQLEEAKIDFELLKSEIEDKGVDGAANSFQVKQLEEQNARYRDALLKFRDISATDRSNIQILQKDVEAKSEEINQLMQLKEKNVSEIEKFNETINELTEQVDMALGSQEMVEKLTEKNLELEDKVEELQKALYEEENIKELSNMIIEEKDDIIADLRDELDRYKTNLVNLRNSYIAMQDAVNDHENTIKKFREVVAALREENTILRATQEQDLTKVQQAVDVQKQLDNIEFKTRLLDRRDLSRAIDMELRQLDVDQCYRYMVYLARFFPESFFVRGGDHDAVAVLLFVPRIFAKCSIIERQVLDKYSSDKEAVSSDSIVREVFGGTTGDQSALHVESLDKLKQQVFTKHILYLLCSIRSILDKYQDVLAKCDSELFMKLGSLFPELSSHEKSIEHYVDLLRDDKLDETVTLDSLEKTLSYLQSLYNIYMAPSANVSTSSDGNTQQSPTVENHNKFLNDLLDVFRTGTEASILDIKIVSQLVKSDASMFVTTLETTLNDIDQFGRKIRRRMLSAGSGSSDTNPACIVRFPLSVEAELFDCVHNLTLTVRCLKTIRASVLLQSLNQSMQSSSADAESEVNKLNYFSMDELDKTCKDLTGHTLKSLGEMLSNVMSAVAKLSTSLQQGDFDVAKSGDSSDSYSSLSSTMLSMQHFNSLTSIQTLFSSSNSANQNRTSLQTMHCAPLDDRAHKWRAQSDQIGEFKNKIIVQEADIGELKRALKAKIDEVSEMQIRRDLAEKKLSTAQKDTNKLHEDLERRTKEFKEKEAEWEKYNQREREKYNQEINELYSDRRMMKEKLKDYSKNSLMGKMMNTSSASANLSGIDSSHAGLSSPPITSSSMQFHHSLNSGLSSSSFISQGTTDVMELHQQIIDLRAAMKRMAKRNYELRMLLSSSPHSCNELTGEQSDKGNALKPLWYVESLKRNNQLRQYSDQFPKFGFDLKEAKIQDLRDKIIDFKYEVLKSRCNTSALPNIEKVVKKPGWTRNLGDLIRKGAQEESLQQIELARQYRELKLQVEEFIKSFEDGYSCEANYTSFLAPHITKAIDSKPQLVARITMPSKNAGDASVIPVEVTLAELKHLSASLMY